MRLIDADKLKEYVNSKSTHPLCEWDTAGVLMAIDAQETVEAELIKHGKWKQIETPDEFNHALCECSICQHKSFHSMENPIVYCPRCGSKMN